MQPTTPTGSRVTSERPSVSSNGNSRAVAGTLAVVPAGRPAWIITAIFPGMPTSREINPPISSLRAPNWPANFSM